jgi:hypothetical protein
MTSWSSLDGFVWLLLMLGPLLLLQPRLHKEIQAVFMLLTRRPALSIGLFSMLFFPGVFIHEASHYITARLLGVRTGRFSLIPRPAAKGKKLVMGYVETAQTDSVRDALIGVAPLVVGGALVAYIGLARLALAPVGAALLQGNAAAFWSALAAMPLQTDFWLWFYLAFAVSSTMLPSEADRSGWLPVVLTVGVLLAIALLVGAGPWMLATVAPRFNIGLRAMAGVFAISLGINLVALLPFWGLHRVLSRVMHLEVH